MGDYEGSESGNWNVNIQYVQILANHFIKIKEYKTIAKFGSSDIYEDYQIDAKTKISLRLKALERYIYELKEIINDTKFAIPNAEKYDEYYKSLEFYQLEVLPAVIKKINNRDKVELQINEEVFSWLFEKLDKIDMDLKVPMNRNDLLFNFKEKFNPKEYKDKIKDKLMNEP